MEEIVITDLTECDADECYCDWFRCPKCDHMMINKRSNYCPNCGAKIKWEITE